MALLSKSREELNGLIPKLDSSGKSEASEALKSVLRKLSSLLNKRDKLVGQFIEAVEAHNTVAFIQSHSNMSDIEQVISFVIHHPPCSSPSCVAIGSREGFGLPTVSRPNQGKHFQAE